MSLLNPLSHSILAIYNLLILITKAFYIKDWVDLNFLYLPDNKIYALYIKVRYVDFDYLFLYVPDHKIYNIVML